MIRPISVVTRQTIASNGIKATNASGLEAARITIMELAANAAKLDSPRNTNSRSTDFSDHCSRAHFLPENITVPARKLSPSGSDQSNLLTLEPSTSTSRLIANVAAQHPMIDTTNGNCPFLNKHLLENHVIAAKEESPIVIASHNSGSESARRSSPPDKIQAATMFRGISNNPISNVPRLVFRSFHFLSV